MDSTSVPSPPFLPFGPLEPREYGSIRLFDPSSELPRSMPFRYSRFIVTPGSTSRRDQHEVLEAWVILTGSGKLLVDGQEFPVSAGDITCFGAMRVHQVINEGALDMHVFSLWWKQQSD